MSNPLEALKERSPEPPITDFQRKWQNFSWRQALFASRPPTRAVQQGSAPFAGETKCGAFGPGLASVDSARNPGRYDLAHPINLLFNPGLRHLLHFLLSHQCSSFVCQDFKLVPGSHIRVLGIVH